MRTGRWFSNRGCRLVSVLVVLVSTGALAEGPQRTGLVLIAGGEYHRGQDLGPGKDIIIKLKDYQIESDEVTQIQYGQCAAAGICQRPVLTGDDSEPVRGISWQDANLYCQFIGRRLPTEAEWEHAAFPQKTPGGGFGPAIPSNLNFCAALAIGGEREEEPCAQRATKPEPIATVQLERGEPIFDRVAHDDGTVFGLFGNVAEWVADWHESGNYFLSYSYFSPPVRENPVGPPEGQEKVIRGGSYLAKGGISMSSRRAAPPQKRLLDVGLRCAADVPGGLPERVGVSSTPPQVAQNTKDVNTLKDFLFFKRLGLVKACAFVLGVLLAAGFAVVLLFRKKAKLRYNGRKN